MTFYACLRRLITLRERESVRAVRCALHQGITKKILGMVAFFMTNLWAVPGWAAGEKPISAVLPSAMTPVGAVLGVNAQPAQIPDMVFGLFVGILITAALYLMFIWIVIRDRAQFFLMLLLLSLAVHMGSTNDSLMQMVGIYSGALRHLLQTYSMILAYFFGLFFTYYFLEIDVNAPAFRPLVVLSGGGLFLLLAVASWMPQLVQFILPTLGTLAVAVILVSGLVAMQAGVGGAISHLTAFGSFLVGSLATPLYDLGYIERLESAKNLSYIAFAFSALLFAIVIAGQFAARQEEKEKELEISNERFSLAVKGSNEGLFDWDRRTNSVYVSDQFRKLAGLEHRETPKHIYGWIRSVHSADRHLVFTALRKLKNAKGTSAIGFEFRVRTQGKAPHWLHTKIVAVKDYDSSRFSRLVGSIGDITARKRSESELKASEARFRSITEAHPVPVLIARLDDGQLLYASPGAEVLLGLPEGTLLSHRLERFLTRATERQEIIDLMKEGGEVNLKEVNVTRGDGEVMAAALSARRITYRGDEAAVIGLYDLTERKEAEKRIAQQQEALQQSEKMAALGGLLAGVAHELNNPLSVVMGQTTLLIETQEDEKTKSRAEKIFKAADRCSRIVKSFLALARRKPPEHKDVDIAGLIQSAIDLLGYQFRNENVELSLDIQENLPPVIGDVDQLTQVFLNLAMNATQAMHGWQGPHKLTLMAQKEESGETILVSVIDTGPGVPQELRRKIFEPFFTTKGGGGTGVGLALCLNIVAGHGGQVILEDTPGGGATFRIRLPIAKAVPADATVGIEKETTIGRQIRILLVDDEVELAQTLADLLEPEGHDIDLAANGQIALEKIRKKPFDAIISDLRMPVLDGPGLYAAFQQEMPEYMKKIIYVTGDTLSVHVNEFLSQTPVPVIEKPYRLADVQAALAKLLKENETQSNMVTGDSARPT